MGRKKSLAPEKPRAGDEQGQAGSGKIDRPETFSGHAEKPRIAAPPGVMYCNDERTLPLAVRVQRALMVEVAIPSTFAPSEAGDRADA